jgi:hypothetical protein
MPCPFVTLLNNRAWQTVPVFAMPLRAFHLTRHNSPYDECRPRDRILCMVMANIRTMCHALPLHDPSHIRAWQTVPVFAMPLRAFHLTRHNSPYDECRPRDRILCMVMANIRTMCHALPLRDPSQQSGMADRPGLRHAPTRLPFDAPQFAI